MVHVSKGLLLRCSDAAIKEFIKYIDEKQLLGKRFILYDLDEYHLFVSDGIADRLQEQLDSLMQRNSYSDITTD